MKNLFYLAGGLLVLGGVLHVANLLVDPGAVLLTIFGAAYLVIGFLLILQRDLGVPLAVIVPGFGLLLAILGLRPNQDAFSTAFIIIDALVVALSAYMLLAGRGRLGRVR